MGRRRGNAERMRSKQRLATHKQAMATIRGLDLKCPKCGFNPLSWKITKSEVNPMKRSCKFKCFRCGLIDCITLTGWAFEVIDFFGALVDRFYGAYERQTEEQSQPLISNT